MALVKSFRGSLPKISVNIANSQYVCTASLLSVRSRQNKPNFWVTRRSCSGCNPAACKVAIVTGGAKGIGKAIVGELLENGARAVIMFDTAACEADQALCEFSEKYGEDRILFQPGDVSCKGDIEKVFTCTKKKFKQLDMVINNAGMIDGLNFEKMINVNVNGVCHGTLLGFQTMGTNKGGKGGYIINIGANVGVEPGHTVPMFSGSKAFVVGLTRAFGNDFYFKHFGVKVMSVCPGLTDTVHFEGLQSRLTKGLEDVLKGEVQHLAKMPKQSPKDVANCVMAALKKNENGSVWLVENGSCVKIKFPPLSSMKEGCDKKAGPPSSPAKSPKGGQKK